MPSHFSGCDRPINHEYETKKLQELYDVTKPKKTLILPAAEETATVRKPLALAYWTESQTVIPRAT